MKPIEEMTTDEMLAELGRVGLGYAITIIPHEKYWDAALSRDPWDNQWDGWGLTVKAALAALLEQVRKV